MRRATLDAAKIFIWILLISSARVALAQPAADPPAAPGTAPASRVTPLGASAGTQDPAAGPGFVVIDQTDASSAVGFQFSFVDTPIGAPSLLRIAVSVREVDPASGLGGYFRLPFVYESGQGDDEFDLGDVEIGGIFSPRLGADRIGLILRAGITLPTGDPGAGADYALTANSLALPDVYNSLPSTTMLKLGASPVIRSGVVSARLDLGFDWVLDSTSMAADKILHFNLGVGADFGTIAVMLESENAMLFDRGVRGVLDVPPSRLTLDALAISVRLNPRSLSPYLAVVLPVHDHLFGESAGESGGILTLGVEVRQ